jgi:hypothetical protein
VTESWVLGRSDQGFPTQEWKDPATPTGTAGRGTHLRALLASIGLRPTGCRCNEGVRLMDAWGVQGCLERREEIVAWLKGEYDRLGWGRRLVAAARAVTTGLAFRIDPADAVGSVVDEVIRRAGPS